MYQTSDGHLHDTEQAAQAHLHKYDLREKFKKGLLKRCPACDGHGWNPLASTHYQSICGVCNTTGFVDVNYVYPYSRG